MDRLREFEIMAANRRISSKYRIDFGDDVLEMSQRLDRHARKKGFEFQQIGNGWSTAEGLGRAESFARKGTAAGSPLRIATNNVPWKRRSGATRDSLTLRVTQTRKTGYISDAFVFTSYHDMVKFRAIAQAYYGKPRDYIVYLQEKWGDQYLIDVAIDGARGFLKSLEGRWGEA